MGCLENLVHFFFFMGEREETVPDPPHRVKKSQLCIRWGAGLPSPIHKSAPIYWEEGSWEGREKTVVH